MKLCKISYKNKGKKVVLSLSDAVLVVGGTNGSGLDPTDKKTKKTNVGPIYKTKSMGG